MGKYRASLGECRVSTEFRLGLSGQEAHHKGSGTHDERYRTGVM